MTMDKSKLTSYLYLCFVILLASSQAHPTYNQQQTDSSNINQHNGNSLLLPVKKDVFMSRGWGASGMPFTILYLDHYTKAQKAYAQKLQQQHKKNRQTEAQQNKELSSKEQLGIDQPRTLPYATRYTIPLANSQLSEYRQTSPKEEEYDNNTYIPTKSNTARRQYNVPQLFVSYGWGPMG